MIIRLSLYKSLFSGIVRFSHTYNTRMDSIYRRGLPKINLDSMTTNGKNISINAILSVSYRKDNRFLSDMVQPKRLPINSSIFVGSDGVAKKNDLDTINNM